MTDEDMIKMMRRAIVDHLKAEIKAEFKIRADWERLPYCPIEFPKHSAMVQIVYSNLEIRVSSKHEVVVDWLTSYLLGILERMVD